MNLDFLATKDIIKYINGTIIPITKLVTKFYYFKNTGIMLIIANIIFIIDIKILKIMLLCSLFILIPKNIVLQI